MDELEAAVKHDRLKTVSGLAWALQRKIQQGIEIRRTSKGSRHIHRAAALLDAAKNNLARSDLDLTRISDAGDFRRGSELVSDLALVAQSARLENGPAVLKNRTGQQKDLPGGRAWLQGPFNDLGDLGPSPDPVPAHQLQSQCCLSSRCD